MHGALAKVGRIVVWRKLSATNASIFFLLGLQGGRAGALSKMRTLKTKLVLAVASRCPRGQPGLLGTLSARLVALSVCVLPAYCRSHLGPQTRSSDGTLTPGTPST